MFKIFFLKELSSGFKRPMAYIFFFVFTLITVITVVNENVNITGAAANVNRNAPYIISRITAFLSIYGLLLATAYFNNAALRDYQNNFNEIIFSTPLQKSGYFFGRFLGALILSTFPLLGVFFGFFIGTDMGPANGWVAADRMGELYFSSVLNNYLIFILPNMFFAGAIIFALANKWKSTMVSFIATLLIVLVYIFSGTLLTDLENESLASMIDAFGFRTFQIETKYWTSIEKNTNVIGFSGALLWNRLLWILIGSVVLIWSYVSFSFLVKQGKQKKVNKNTDSLEPLKVFSKPNSKISLRGLASLSQFISFFKANFYSILRNNTFKILFLLSISILIASILNGFDYYGLKSYPVTYKMIKFVGGITTILVMIILVFFSGELVWRDRMYHISGVIDATPHNSLNSLFAKALSLIALTSLMNFALILIAILYQLSVGYFNIEISVYLQDYFYSSLPTYIIWSCILIFIQVSMNHKYLGYFVAVLLLFLFDIFVESFGIESYMFNLGTVPFYKYSDMNGFGAALKASQWYNFYWLLFGLLLMSIAGLMWVRGNTKGFKNRYKTARKHATGKYLVFMGCISLLFLATAANVYYNTEVLNPYKSASTLKNIQVAYEKKYKKYQYKPQPKISEVKYEVEIFPEERTFIAVSILTLKNETHHDIDSLFFTTLGYIDDDVFGLKLKLNPWDLQLKIPGATKVLDDEELRFQAYRLHKTLKPHEEIKIEVKANYTNKGFENEVSNVRVAKNGTFVENSFLIPVIGYSANYELLMENDRKKYQLPDKKLIPDLVKHCYSKCSRNYITDGNSDWVNVETIISTSSDQIAVAPGSLIKEWKEKNRNYYQYKLDHPSQNFYNFVSARYSVARKKWNDIDIEVYYHKSHDYNVQMMLSAVERSLDYYTKNFGPYYHKQARIIEFPRYFSFAQAFPGTMPYSEELGFITNLENEEDNNVVDAVIAHEMAHQWWGHQVLGATMQGATLLSEAFAEYSSLMVMKHTVKDQKKMKQFLKYELDRYLKGRGRESKKEMPLYKVEYQPYIHYGKGSMIMYALQEYIGEEAVNRSLKNFLEAHKFSKPNYPTTYDYLGYLEAEVPDSLHYLIDDWFKEVTLYDLRLKEASYKKVNDQQFEVNVNIESWKLQLNEESIERKVGQSDWIEVGVFAGENDEKVLYSEKLLFTDSVMNFTIKVDQKPDKVIVDPRMLLIEKVHSDNSKIVVER